MDSTSSSRRTAWFFAIYVAVVLPLCFLGYGSDNDTYGVLEAGRSTWRFGHLMTSRNPGYWLYEALVYFVSHFGGPVATNIASMCAGAFILWRLIVLCRRMGIGHEYLLTSCVLFVPTFLIAASSTIDYVWSIAFLIGAAELLLDSRFAMASIVGAIAIGFRVSNSVVLAGVYAGLLLFGFKSGWQAKEIGKINFSGISAAVLGTLFLVPSWQVAHHTLDFLTPSIGPAAMWTLKMHVGRFIYKSIYLFGPVATLILLFLLARYRKLPNFSSHSTDAGKGFSIFLGAFLGNIVLFAKFPIEVSYLLPGMVFFLLVAGMTFLNLSRTGIVVVLCAIILFNFFSISLAKPNTPLHATNATLTFSPRSGVLLEDIRIRLKAKKCDTVPCWAKNVAEQPEV